jgi:hypothetical protein
MQLTGPLRPYDATEGLKPLSSNNHYCCFCFVVMKVELPHQEIQTYNHFKGEIYANVGVREHDLVFSCTLALVITTLNVAIDLGKFIL